MFSHSVPFWHNNASADLTKVAQSSLTSFEWNVFSRVPYLPDLPPFDCHLFLHLKQGLGAKCFGSKDEVLEVWVNEYNRNLDSDFYHNCFWFI